MDIHNVQTYKIVGNTCMEHDVIIEEYIEDCECGDFLMFENRGAYSSVLTLAFIMPSPPITGMNEAIYKIRDDVNFVLAVYNYKKND